MPSEASEEGALNRTRNNDAAAELLRSFPLGRKDFSSPLREVPDVLLGGVVLQQAHQETQGLLGGVHGAAGHRVHVLRRVPAPARKPRTEDKMNATIKTE